MSSTITVAAPPTTVEVATQVMSWQTGQSGVITDYNVGSQIRTLSEAIGSVEELSGVAAQALAFQALVYSAYSAFGITPLDAAFASGTITFSTGTGSNPPPAAQSIAIPAGTLVQTIGGTQFQTAQSVVLLQNSTSISAPITATVAGISGNVSANTITQIVTGLPYALYCNNSAATTGGQAAEVASATLARFTAAVAATGLSTPVAVANACIGVTVSGTGEIVAFSNCYEPWIVQALNGQTPVAGFQVYVDNGSGNASSALLSQVQNTLNGILGTPTLGYRPAGVPYTVNAVSPVYSTVVVSGVTTNSSLISSLTNAAISAIQAQYAALGFTQTLEQSNILADVANAVAPNISSLAVYLVNASGAIVSGIATAYNQRNILQSYTVNFTS